MTKIDPPASGASLRDLTASQYARFSELLDASLEMDDAGREAWLKTMEKADPQWAAFLRAFVVSRHEDREKLLETAGFLSRHPSLTEATSSLIGRQYGPYRILSLLGHGGMGSVWLAERVDGLFTRQVALKLVHPALVSPVQMERSAREREILASLNHPNIARLIDAGVAADGQPYLALEYVAGTSLTEFCDQRRLPVRDRLQLFRQVLSAVQYAHAHLVIHRDLKPSNIMVTKDGQVFLLDFGIAKLLTEGQARETELTRMGGRALTPDYAAPEQIAGAPITTAADVYALGVMLYELLVGERPYRLKRDTRGALEEAILEAAFVAPSRAELNERSALARGSTRKLLSKTMRGELDTIVAKALRKLPAERYATANAFDEDVARYLRGDIVLAQRDTLAYRIRKFVRRHRLALGVVGVLLLTLAAGLAATTYEASVASSQRDAAFAARARALTQTAAARLKDSDIQGALGILMALTPRPETRSYDAEELNVFQESLAADGQALAITGHTGPVHLARYSPDGRRILTASEDGTARIWDAATGRELLEFSGFGASVRSANFSPDGKRVVTAGYDKNARIWDAETGRQQMLISGEGARVHYASFSPDGQSLVISTGAGHVRIWNAISGQPVRELKGHSKIVSRALFSPNGTQVATSSYDGTVRLWNAATGQEVLRLAGHTNQVWDVAYSADGSRIATASLDDTARVWDSATGRQLLVLGGHHNTVTSAQFSPDGLQIVTSSEDGTTRIWDAATGREIVQLNGRANLVEHAEFSPDGRQIVTACFDGTARVWKLKSDSLVRVLDGHSDLVSSADFSPDNARLLTASWDGTARIWEALTGSQVLALSADNEHVEFAAFSNDGKRVVTASVDMRSRVWDSQSGHLISTLNGHSERVETAQFSPDGARVVSASWDKTGRIWDASTGQPLQVLRGHTDKLDFAAYSPDGKRVVTASYDKTARIWDAASGSQIAILAGHAQRVGSAAFSPDGTRIVTASNDKTARVWDAATGEQLLVLGGHEEGVETASYSPDGRSIVTGSYDRTARIWDSSTGAQLKVLSGHADAVETARYSPDGRYIVTASDDKTARVWDAHVISLEAQFAWVRAAQFDPLPESERSQLGLFSDSARRWPAHPSKCDETAAAPHDPDRRARGLAPDQIVTDIAMAACAQAILDTRDKARAAYQMGRVLASSGRFSEARRNFESAAALGYRTARVELADLQSDPAAGMLNISTAIALYREAWNDGVRIAAFRLGTLFEQRVSSTSGGESQPARDEANAWMWYQKGADEGEPNALARLAQRSEAAAAAASAPKIQNASDLDAFKYYASAAEAAQGEDWPDAAWKNWRYHRASLARRLAGKGMMQEVADAYRTIYISRMDTPR